MNIFDRVIDEFKTNKIRRERGEHLCVPIPFSNIQDSLPGIEQRRYIIVTANSKVGKSKITNQIFVYDPIDWFINNPETNLKLKIMYFTLEQSAEEKITEAIIYKLFTKHDIRIKQSEIRSVGDILTDEKLNKICNLKSYFNKYLSMIDYIYGINNATGIYKYVKSYAEKNGVYMHPDHPDPVSLIDYNNMSIEKKVQCYYKPNDPDEIVLVITDHLALLSPETVLGKYMDLRETIGYFSSNYCLKMRDAWYYTVVNVQQQAASQEGVENLKASMLRPSPSGLGENKTTQRDCDVMLGLFSPFRMEKPKWEGYNINILKDNYRELLILLNRRGYATATDLYFDGASGYFYELPDPNSEEITKVYKNLTNG